MVYRITQEKGLRGASLLGAFGNQLRELMRRWLNSMKEERLQFVHLLASPASTLLKIVKNGRFSITMPFSRSPHYLTVKPLNYQHVPMLLDFERWHCSGGQIL